MDIILDNLASASPDVSTPNIIGCYSVDENLDRHYDASELRYFYPPPTKEDENIFDLTYSIRRYRNERLAVTDSQRLEWMLEWIKRNIEKIQDNPSSGRWIKSNFILGGVLLFKIMQTPFLKSQAWTIHAVKFKGSIYLCGFNGRSNEIPPEKSPEINQFIAGDTRFTQLLSTTNPERPPESSEHESKNGEFHRLMQRRFQDKHILYNSWTGLIDLQGTLEEPLELCGKKFVVARTLPYSPTKNQISNVGKTKYLRWWTMGFIGDIERFICGYRTEQGIVKRIRTLCLHDLEKTDKKKSWTGAKCLNFLDKFLDFVRETVIDDYDETVYIFNRLRNSSSINVTTAEPSPEVSFLPSWYTE